MSDVTDLKAEVLLLRKENKELCDEIRLNPLECTLSEAQAFRGQVAALQAENAGLRDENEKLRELVKHLSACNYYTSIECENVHCYECPYDNDIGNCDFDRRMRELGVIA